MDRLHDRIYFTNHEEITSWQQVWDLPFYWEFTPSTMCLHDGGGRRILTVRNHNPANQIPIATILHPSIWQNEKDSVKRWTMRPQIHWAGTTATFWGDGCLELGPVHEGHAYEVIYHEVELERRDSGTYRYSIMDTPVENEILTQSRAILLKLEGGGRIHQGDRIIVEPESVGRLLISASNASHPNSPIGKNFGSFIHCHAHHHLRWILNNQKDLKKRNVKTVNIFHGGTWDNSGPLYQTPGASHPSRAVKLGEHAWYEISQEAQQLLPCIREAGFALTMYCHGTSFGDLIGNDPVQVIHSLVGLAGYYNVDGFYFDNAGFCHSPTDILMVLQAVQDDAHVCKWSAGTKWYNRTHRVIHHNSVDPIGGYIYRFPSINNCVTHQSTGETGVPPGADYDDWPWRYFTGKGGQWSAGWSTQRPKNSQYTKEQLWEWCLQNGGDQHMSCSDFNEYKEVYDRVKGEANQ